MNERICANPVIYSRKYAGKKIHLGITGSIACYKTLDLLRMLLTMDIGVSVTLTKGAKKFLTPVLFSSLGANPVYDEWFSQQDMYAHLEPGQFADLLAVVPASADFIAKMAAGFADELLACQCLAFLNEIIVAPAMNYRMWENTVTQANVKLLQQRGFVIIPPESGNLACGEKGAGRLASPDQLLLYILKSLTGKDLAGLKVMVTLGPTREAWDKVRYWSNPSSGKMGTALATVAWLRGAQVYAICGPGIEPDFPQEIIRINVESARQMYAEAEKLWSGMDWGLFCAAVADFSPVCYADGKLVKASKKELGENFQIRFASNPDILSSLASRKTDRQKVLGFAAQIVSEPSELINFTREKLINKKANLMAGNMVNPGSGAFGAQAAAMTVVDCHNNMEEWTNKNKADIAWDLLTWLLKI